MPISLWVVLFTNYSQAIKGLTDKLDKEVEKVAPRPRFQFKPRSKPSGAVKDDRRILGKPTVSESSRSTPSTASSQPTPPPPKDYNTILRSPPYLVKRPSFSSVRSISLATHENLHVVLPEAASAATSYGDLSDLEDCVVDLSVPTRDEPFSGMALRNAKRCVVVTGNVAGAVHITGVSDAVIVVSSRQVRIHECERVDFYLHCSSHPIIEDCGGVRFAPIPDCYVSILLICSPFFIFFPLLLVVICSLVEIKLTREDTAVVRDA